MVGISWCGIETMHIRIQMCRRNRTNRWENLFFLLRSLELSYQIILLAHCYISIIYSLELIMNIEAEYCSKRLIHALLYLHLSQRTTIATLI